MLPHQPDIERAAPLEDDPEEREMTDDELDKANHGTTKFPKGIERVGSLVSKPKKKLVRGTVSKILPSQFTEFAFRMPRQDGLGYEPFSFKGRRHMLRPYNTNATRILLFCGRQVEKCQTLTSLVYSATGEVLEAGSIQVGNRVACLDMRDRPGTKFTDGEVVWVSSVSSKPSVRITTRQGHRLEVAKTHPLRIWGEWLEASEIKPGHRVASVRRCGTFGIEQVDPRRVELTAFMVGDGGLTQPAYTYTAVAGVSLDRVESLLAGVGHTYRKIHRNGAHSLSIRHDGPLYGWMAEDGLSGKYSYEKSLPPWVFRLDRERTALFLNRLWSTDGHVKQNSASKYSIEYCSTSRQLVLQVQSLLWKFGVPTRIRENQPSYTRTNGEPARLAYILRVETREGVRNFLQHVGALGKSESVSLPEGTENNNRDTYPEEINELIRAIINSRGTAGRRGRNAEGSLRSAGLREKLKYPPSTGKLREYAAFFSKDPRYDQRLVASLVEHIESDVYWDVVTKVEDIGPQDCVDFEVAEHHNYLLNGVVTHNSTLLGNIILSYSCIVAAYKTLYVSPSATQTKVFSADRIKEPIETSEVLKAFTNNMLSMNILEKQFINRAKITLRYAFLNADRTRGIPAWLLALDEIQDILSDNIPVIEQCTSHAPEQFKRFIYAGTPKGLDNSIEYYRSGVSKDGKSMSTQGEWVVPCDGHGGEGGRYWNILGEKNIGKTSLICEKCGKQIDPMHPDAQWAPQFRDGIFESYRIPQLMVPWRSWDEILLDYSRYPRDKFYNEVLGISYDSGMRPLTLGQVKECCNPLVTMHPDVLEQTRKKMLGSPVFAGVDWGSGENSYTVACLGAYFDDKFRIFWIHRFMGEDTDPQIQVKKLVQIFRAFNVKVIGSDYGGGFASNNVLAREFGVTRLQKFQYQGKVRKKVFMNPQLQRWIVHRTEVMSDVFAAIKRKQIEFPRWEEFREPYAQDMLNIFSEYNETLRMIQYQHRPDRPDDSFHTVLYCFLASMMIHPRPDIIVPKREFENQGPNRGGYSGPLWQG